MKSAEIYGFVGWVSSFIIFFLYIIWVFVPDSTLHKYEIYYYPDKSWALAIPSLISMTLVAVFVGYQSINMINNREKDNLSVFQDEYTKFKPNNENTLTDSLPEVYDLPINVVNNAIFYQKDLIQKRVEKHQTIDNEDVVSSSFGMFRNKSFT